MLGLSADPSAHIDVAVCSPGPVRIRVKAYSGLSRLAIAAASACDIERHGDYIAEGDKLDIPARLEHFTGDLMTKYESRGCSGSAPYHVLVGSADVGGDNFKDHAMLAIADRTSVLELQDRIRNVRGLDPARSEVDDSAIGHGIRSYLEDYR